MILIDGEQHYTAKEFADKVGVKKRYICRLCAANRLPSKQPDGRMYLIPASAFVVWAKRKEQK